MIFLISLLLAALLITTGKNFIRKHAGLCYLFTAVISAAVVICTLTGVTASFPAWFTDWVWPIFSRSAFSTALFVAVMYAGAARKGSALVRTVMPIRGELSIMASILTLGHNISYGKTYFRLLFTRPGNLPRTQLLAAICSLLMLCIMLPLFVTSFHSVRRKMKPRSWKRLQRLAYGFYALIYVHVLLLTVPGAQKGDIGYWITVLAYSAVFLTYGVCRVGKALQKSGTAIRRLPALAGACVLVLVLCITAVPGLTSAQEVSGVQMAEQKEAETGTENDMAPETENDISEPEPEQTEETTLPEIQTEAAGTAENTEIQTEPDQTEHNQGEQTDDRPEAQAQTAVTTAAETLPTSLEQTPAQPEAPAANEEPATAEEPAAAEEPKIVEEPAAPAVVYQYQSGTFTGSGEGFEGTITVSVTIENDVITGISILSGMDDDPYWTQGQSIISSILAAQSAEVDTISGATFSSSGIRDAVRAALNSARN